jgi:peptidoglycan/xylan/chitin deacetylase (PgdA/CDA1 family)
MRNIKYRLANMRQPYHAEYSDEINNTPAFVISLDFELFWGVSHSRSIDNYRPNIEGVWRAVPAMLALFKQYGVHATWATVGMLMCKDYKHWCDMRPSVMQTYVGGCFKNYSIAALARDNPKLFFGRPLVEQILAADGQEIASHTYSHFLCDKADISVEYLAADIKCTQAIFNEFGIKPTSVVFPRNQVHDGYKNLLFVAGFTAYRGNQDHWIYQNGHQVPYIGRFLRFTDAYLSYTGNHVSQWTKKIPIDELTNIPASKFLRPSLSPTLDDLLINRIKGGMLEAARTNGLYHLWWHPHNFGKDTETNLKNLEKLLKYYQILNQKFGMRSMSMKEVSESWKRH